MKWYYNQSSSLESKFYLINFSLKKANYRRKDWRDQEYEAQRDRELREIIGNCPFLFSSHNYSIQTP